jgi:hypothetical protein
MFKFALLGRCDWQNLDQFESGFAKLRKARDGQRQRRGHAQLAGTVFVRNGFVIARGLLIMLMGLQARTSDHAGNLQQKFTRDEHHQGRQHPRLEVQGSKGAFEMAEGSRHCSHFKGAFTESNENS